MSVIGKHDGVLVAGGGGGGFIGGHLVAALLADGHDKVRPVDDGMRRIFAWIEGEMAGTKGHKRA